MIPDASLDFMAHGLLNWPVWKIVVAALVLTHVTIAAVTIYLHRCQAHRALDLHPIPAHFFRFWLWLTTGMQTKEWAAIHRKHHAKCETPDDPHSPQTRGLKTVLWSGAELYMAESANAETLEKYGHGTPKDWVERNVYSRFVWHGLGLMLIADWALFGVGAGTTVWAVQMIWIPFFAAGIINGVGHFWGYRNFEATDASRNILPWGILIGGEELHNNHHTFATSARLSNKWYEFDIGWMYIRILAALRLATVKKVAPRPRLQTPRAEIDFDSLNAVISNRYDVMAKYAKSYRAAIREEIARLRAHAAPSAVHVTEMRRAKRWIHRDTNRLTEERRATLTKVLENNPTLHKLHEMRVELAAIWERSSASRDQLLHQLQDWCKRAEESKIRPLQEFSLRLKSYA